MDSLIRSCNAWNKTLIPGLCEQLADMMFAATSSSMFLELTDRLGYTPDQSGDMAMKMIAALLSDFESSADGAVSSALPQSPTPKDDA